MCADTRRIEYRVRAADMAVQYLCNRPNTVITEQDLITAFAVDAQLSTPTTEYIGTRTKTRFDYNREFYTADITVRILG
jgi:hypothetical protein